MTGKPTPGRSKRGDHRPLSPLTRRILAVNVLALMILVGGVLYVGLYRQGLIASELDALRIQAELFAAALGESAPATEEPGLVHLPPHLVHPMVRRMASATGNRARLFGPDGALMADSRLLLGPGGAVQIEELPPPRGTVYLEDLLDAYDRIIESFPGRERLPLYRENAVQEASDYEEVSRALAGEVAQAVRSDGRLGTVLSVAVPVQRYKQVLGALLISKGSQEIDTALLEVRVHVLGVFALAMGVTMFLSVYLAGTIARPIRRLAAAADRVRREQSRRHAIPDLSARDDEIGDLAMALRDMTEALWTRFDAIERFAADVAHEIKNPLTSLRSAVETVGRVKDPAQREKLMAIIQEDVSRLDRLISDISDASRLDAELSRAEKEPVDLGRMLDLLAEIHDTTGPATAGGARLEVTVIGTPVILGVEGRLVQVFRNLIANAQSFSPEGGVIRVAVTSGKDGVTVTVDDDGPGIQPGKEEAIFERFYSERPQGEKFGTHSGLGLSISRQIIQAHGGALRAWTRPEGGACFLVEFPLPPATREPREARLKTPSPPPDRLRPPSD